MQTKSDIALLREYAEQGSEAAFTEIVSRHADLVYSAALRQVNSPDAARDVLQNVFTGLARAAQALSRAMDQDASLAGWLCRSARNLSLKLRRDEFRRHSRERQAMQDLEPVSEIVPDWDRLRPVLDEAMSGLSDSDHDALVLRYFKNQGLREVGTALGLSEDAAQKRVSRALDRLRVEFSRRGVTTTVAALASAVSANAVTSAPGGLASGVAEAALASATAAGSTIPALIEFMGANKIKVALGAALLAGLTATLLIQQGKLDKAHGENADLRRQVAEVTLLREQTAESEPARREERGNSATLSSELLRLRGEVGLLRRELQRTMAAQAAYHGWVHITTSMGGRSFVRHVNTADKTIAWTDESNGQKGISYLSPAQGIWAQFSEAAGEIRLQELGPPDVPEAGFLLAAGPPPTLTTEAALNELRVMLNSTQPDVIRSEDGPWVKFEVTSEHGLAENGVTKVTVWADPTTELVNKVQTQTAAGSRPGKAAVVDSVVSFAYGPPAYPDIYALGAPRNARVIDMRPGPATRAILQRTRAVLEPRLGDYVAVLTQTASVGGGPETPGGALSIHGRRGEEFFQREYLVGPASDTSDVSALGFAGWPAPALTEVAAAIHGRLPSRVKLGNSEGGTEWKHDPGTPGYLRTRMGRPLEPVDVLSYAFAMRWGFVTLDPNVRITLLEDAGHPGLKGLRRESFLSSRPLPARAREDVAAAHGARAARGEVQAVTVLWVDPARGCRPVAYDEPATFSAAPDKLPEGSAIRVTKYEEYGQLPDGTPYPTKWSYEYPEFDYRLRPPSYTGKMALVEYRLCIEPKTPEPQWFIEQ
jgi:RNA polymerase sigma factor (sigma-70 family)